MLIVIVLGFFQGSEPARVGQALNNLQRKVVADLVLSKENRDDVCPGKHRRFKVGQDDVVLGVLRALLARHGYLNLHVYLGLRIKFSSVETLLITVIRDAEVSVQTTERSVTSTVGVQGSQASGTWVVKNINPSAT
jgi:hypothetical protein